MTRESIIAIASLLAASSVAQAEPFSARLAAEARLMDRAGVDVVGALVLPSVIPSGAASITSVVSSGPANPNDPTTTTERRGVGNTSLMIQRQSSEAVSMAVPETFQVVRTGGSEALTVRTTTGGGYNLGDGILMGASSPEIISVNVAGALAPATTALAPGAYQGALRVVVQYN